MSSNACATAICWATSVRPPSPKKWRSRSGCGKRSPISGFAPATVWGTPGPSSDRSFPGPRRDDVVLVVPVPVKFIHAADIHLDSPLEGLERYEGAPVEEIRGATRRAFENMVRLAIAEPVDFVLIAGDLYDGEWRDAGTGLYFIRQVVKLKEAGIPVFVVLGNHDAANKMTRELPLPDNVRLFSHRAPQTVTLDDLGVAVHGQSFARADITDDLAAGYPAPVADAFNIGLLHTCATGFAGHDRYAPTSVETLQQRGYQYWALGHVHTARTLSEKPPVVFPGNLQGRRITEAGPKGCQVVTVNDDETVERRFEAVDVVRWLTLEVDVAGVAALDEAVNRVEEQLRHLVG
ncbi:MAG: DNA repair exonuclease, partial [bacterium]|nr:DNA repair exonuclease [bacterium]